MAFVCLLAPAGIHAEPMTASFSDSHGRTLLYRYDLPEGSNPEVPQGVLIYFHGNNMATQVQILDSSGLINLRDYTRSLRLVPVVVASPEESRFRSGVRNWYPADGRLVHELLQSDFGGRFRVDRERVFLWGGSQGTCFLNSFVRRYGEHYGGGLYAECGCIVEDPLWNPSEEFARRFRVFVQTTTEDFLHGESLKAYGYYRYTLGLETRSDLAAEGGHCSGGGDVHPETALSWLANGTGLPDEPEHAHLKRVSIMDFAVGLAADTDGALWVARQPPGGEARLWRSIDRGGSFYPVSRIGIPVSDLDAAGGALLATHREPESPTHSLYRSRDDGLTFEPVDVEGVPLPAATVTDRHGQVYLATDSSGSLDVYATGDLGDSWTSLGFSTLGREKIVNTAPLVNDEASGFLFTGNQYEVFQVGSTEGGDWNAVSKSPRDGRVRSIAWDGEMLWALADDPRLLYRSADRGLTWTEVSRPPDIDDWWWGTQLNALDHRQIFVLGPIVEGYLRNGLGDWNRIYGSSLIKGGVSSSHRLAFDHRRGDVYFTAGSGIFRLDGAMRSIHGLEPRPDSDSDGIPDALDAFPGNGAEYLDTDGDGVGNNRDEDDDGDGVRDGEDQVPLDPDETVDTDGDGIGDRDDVDDDGDGVRDVVDAFPLDAREAADSDRDGTGDEQDRDDDGDGVADTRDAFRLYPGEWRDTDGDGIGDNADTDDDGDGRDDAYDPTPLVGKPAGHLRFTDFLPFAQPGYRGALALTTESAPHVRYPAREGRSQWFGEVRLGDGAHPPVHLMVDNLGGHLAWVHADRNGNADLTDDGPPLALVGDNTVTAVFDIAYRSGEVVPYALNFRFRFSADGESVSLVHPLTSGATWRGDVAVVGGAHIDVWAGDWDADGVFSGQRDPVCVDIDKDRNFADCANETERFSHGDTFVLDGREVQIAVAASGHRAEIGSPAHPVPYMPAASHPDWQGFVQVTNRGDEDGEVEIHAYDDAGSAYGPLTLTLGARSTKSFNSEDLEHGNSKKGLSGGTGDGDGAWRLALSSDLDLDVLTYVRTTDGFLTRMHDMAPRDARAIRVPTFNPGSNRNQVSVLRLVNPSTQSAEVTIEGIDDAGASPGEPVRLSVPAGAAREISAQDLESGGEDLTGALGDGKGKWRLSVVSEQPVRALSLLRSPTGHITNLSTPPYEDGGPLHHVSMFPAASDPNRQGFVRIVNHSDESGEVTVSGYDDTGVRSPPVTLAIDARATVHFNSYDLEQGNADKGLESGTGPGDGDWRLEFESDLELQVMGYVRTEDGFLTSMHDAFHRGEGGIHVPTFNPGSNTNQVSLLRLINPGDEERRVAITGVDGNGASPGSTVRLSVAPRSARTFTSLELESGNAEGLSGVLGTGKGKWQLTVEPDGPLRVMSLLESPTGHLTNLSTMPERFPSRRLAAHAAKEEQAASANKQPAAAPSPSALGQESVAVVTEPNVIVADTETMGRIYFDLGALSPDGPRTLEYMEDVSNPVARGEN